MQINAANRLRESFTAPKPGPVAFPRGGGTAWEHTNEEARKDFIAKNPSRTDLRMDAPYRGHARPTDGIQAPVHNRIEYTEGAVKPVEPVKMLDTPKPVEPVKPVAPIKPPHRNSVIKPPPPREPIKPKDLWTLEDPDDEKDKEEDDDED